MSTRWRTSRWLPGRGVCGGSGGGPGGGGGGAAAMTVDLIKITPSPLELGQVLPVGTQFQTSESDAAGPLVSATIQDDDGNAAVDILGQGDPVPNAGMGFSYEKTAIGDTVSFTYVADDGVTVAQDVETYVWLPRVYLGIALPAAVDEAFIEALGESELRADKGIARAAQAWGIGTHIYVAFPQAFNPTDTFDFLVGAFPGGFILDTAGVAVTANTGGTPVPVLYDVWRSIGAGIGNTVDITVSP